MKEEFPYEKFPIKLIHKENKDSKTCYFECEDHLSKYLKRHNLKVKDVIVKRNGS